MQLALRFAIQGFAWTLCIECRLSKGAFERRIGRVVAHCSTISFERNVISHVFFPSQSHLAEGGVLHCNFTEEEVNVVAILDSVEETRF